MLALNNILQYKYLTIFIRKIIELKKQVIDAQGVLQQNFDMLLRHPPCHSQIFYAICQVLLFFQKNICNMSNSSAFFEFLKKMANFVGVLT